MTIYQELLNLGYTDEDMLEAADHRAPTRGFSLAMADTPDGVPIVGITYACDFRSEEESGSANLPKAFGAVGHEYMMTKAGVGHAGVFEGIPSLILSVRPIAPVQSWGHNIVRDSAAPTDRRDAWLNLVAHGSLDQVSQDYYADNYDTHYGRALERMQELPDVARYGTIDRIKEAAAKIGIPGPFPRKKAELIEYVTNHPVRLALAENPSVWPGWFHNGDVLVLRADKGIVADTLKSLARAAKSQTLAFGGGHQLFGSGMSLYDGADVGPKLEAERKAYAQWYDAEKLKLEPVKAELTRRGFKWYALGRPTLRKDGRVEYWLNGAGFPQPYGWYTREELLAEKFVADMAAKK